jgi:hypothetical protein
MDHFSTAGPTDPIPAITLRRLLKVLKEVEREFESREPTPAPVLPGTASTAINIPVTVTNSNSNWICFNCITIINWFNQNVGNCVAGCTCNRCCRQPYSGFLAKGTAESPSAVDIMLAHELHPARGWIAVNADYYRINRTHAWLEKVMTERVAYSDTCLSCSDLCGRNETLETILGSPRPTPTGTGGWWYKV